MYHKKNSRKPMSEINVVPYIDVTLVLLVIFMITAPLLQSGVDVELPQASAKAIDQQQQTPLIITVDKQGQYYIEDETLSAKQLLIHVKAVLTMKPDTPVYIKGDRSVQYGKVVAVMAGLRNAGLANVGLMTQAIDN